MDNDQDSDQSGDANRTAASIEMLNMQPGAYVITVKPYNADNSDNVPLVSRGIMGDVRSNPFTPVIDDIFKKSRKKLYRSNRNTSALASTVSTVVLMFAYFMWQYFKAAPDCHGK